MKHIPTAISCELGNWAVYSDIGEKLINHTLNLDTGVSCPIRETNKPNLIVASEGISAKYKSDAWIILIELPE